jgi:hypothetical protein
MKVGTGRRDQPLRRRIVSVTATRSSSLPEAVNSARNLGLTKRGWEAAFRVRSFDFRLGWLRMGEVS